MSGLRPGARVMFGCGVVVASGTFGNDRPWWQFFIGLLMLVVGAYLGWDDE